MPAVRGVRVLQFQRGSPGGGTRRAITAAGNADGVSQSAAPGQGADGSMHGLHGVDQQLIWIGRGFAGEPARVTVICNDVGSTGPAVRYRRQVTRFRGIGPVSGPPGGRQAGTPGKARRRRRRPAGPRWKGDPAEAHPRRANRSLGRQGLGRVPTEGCRPGGFAAQVTAREPLRCITLPVAPMRSCHRGSPLSQGVATLLFARGQSRHTAHTRSGHRW